MSINTRNEELLSLSAAARKMPRFGKGKHPHPTTIWRWCTDGIGGVKLDHVRVGRRICTSVEALDRFLNRESHFSEEAVRYESRAISHEASKSIEIEGVSERLRNEGI